MIRIKTANLVSISFPGRDLSLASVYLKGFALMDPSVRREWKIDAIQFDTDTADSEIDEALNRSRADLYCFSLYVWNYDKALAAARRIKERDGSATVLMGGPEASGLSRHLLMKYSFVDYVISGDGEIAFREFLMREDPADVPNLVYRKSGKIMENPKVQLDDFSALPMHHESADYARYLDESPAPVRAAIETSRGCSFSCGYCNWGGQRVRYYDLAKVKPALKYLLNHSKVSLVYITDSNPLLDRKRGKELLEFIISNNTQKKPVVFELNPEYMDDNELLSLVAKLNNDEFAFGVQSTSDSVLKLIKRPFNRERYKRNIEFIRKANPKVKMWFSLILGLPGDNYRQFLDSTEFVLSMRPDGIYFHELLCLPGSDFYSRPEHYGLEFMEEPPHKVLGNVTFRKKEYDAAKRLAYSIFLLQKVPGIRDRIQELHESLPEKRLVDIYSRLSDMMYSSGLIEAGQVDSLFTWYFERDAEKRLSRGDFSCRMDKVLIPVLESV